MLRLFAHAQAGQPYHLIAMDITGLCCPALPLCFPGSASCLLSGALAFNLLLLILTSPSPKKSKPSRECFCNLPSFSAHSPSPLNFLLDPYVGEFSDLFLSISSQSVCLCGRPVSTTVRCIIVHLQRLFLGTCTMLANYLLCKHKDVTWIRSLVLVGKARHVVWVCSSSVGAREWGSEGRW